MGGSPGKHPLTRIAQHTRLRARELRAGMTAQERRLWAHLRDLNRIIATHFRRQAPVGPYIADFADLGRRLVIEVDGGGHGGPKDQARDVWFASQGFHTLRFWNAEVDGNLAGVMQVVLDALDRPPPPAPPHEGEGRREMTGGLSEAAGDAT